MWRSMFKVMAATTAFAVVHSALASRGAKRAATKTFGAGQKVLGERDIYNVSTASPAADISFVTTCIN